MSHYIQRAAKGKLRAIELEVNPKIKIVEVPAAALAGTGEAAGLPEGIMLPAGWTYDPGQVLSFCDTVTGKCYDEEYMKRQQSGVRKLDF